MSRWTPAQLQKVTGGRWVAEPGDADMAITGFTTDSRAVEHGQAFIALRGGRFDGHDFLNDVANAGAAVLIVDRHEKADMAGASDAAVLLVDSTVLALQDIARAHRQMLLRAGCKVIAVTGSNGKTTTRNLIHAILSTTFRGKQSPKSFNNHLGVPLTLLSASPADQFVVVEVGTNHPGEIALLADIIRPDAAVITNIGRAHIGNFGSREAIAREKSSLLAYVRRDGVAVHPGDEPLLEKVELPDGCRRVLFGRTDASDLVLSSCEFDAGHGGIRMVVQTVREDDPFGGWEMHGLELKVNLLGEHNAMNVMAAIGVARWMCVDVQSPKVADALEHLQPADMRLNVRMIGDPANPVMFINDAYNANPDSVAAAIGTMRDLDPPSGRRVIILGDMLELGEQAPTLHKQVGQQLAETGNPATDHAVLIGRLSMFTADAIARQWPADRVHAMPDWTDALPAKVADIVEPGDLVLIKASRGMALERLVPAIEAKLGGKPLGTSH